MNIEEIREYCLALPDSIECLPFDNNTIVFKVTLRNGKAKIFALISLSKPNYLLLKCKPELAVELRERYAEIEPGFHMNKTHWNGVYTDGSLPESTVSEMIDHSYYLVKGK